MKLDANYEQVVAFHGHSCPGLALGYRVADAAIEALELGRSVDEEIVAIVENNACGTDAIQFMLGATFGKGNLIFKDYGKHVFTIFRRDDGRAVRIVADFLRPQSHDQAAITEAHSKIQSGTADDNDRKIWESYKALKVNHVLTAPAENFLKVELVNIDPPPKAKVVESVLCESCGEKVMGTKTIDKNGRKVCLPCSEIRS